MNGDAQTVAPHGRAMLTDSHAAILGALVDGPMTLREIARACGMSYEGVRSAMPLLQSRRLVARLSEPVQMGMGRPSVVYRRVTTWERVA